MTPLITIGVLSNEVAGLEDPVLYVQAPFSWLTLLVLISVRPEKRWLAMFPPWVSQSLPAGALNATAGAGLGDGLATAAGLGDGLATAAGLTAGEGAAAFGGGA